MGVQPAQVQGDTSATLGSLRAGSIDEALHALGVENASERKRIYSGLENALQKQFGKTTVYGSDRISLELRDGTLVAHLVRGGTTVSSLQQDKEAPSPLDRRDEATLPKVANPVVVIPKRGSLWTALGELKDVPRSERESFAVKLDDELKELRELGHTPFATIQPGDSLRVIYDFDRKPERIVVTHFTDANKQEFLTIDISLKRPNASPISVKDGRRVDYNLAGEVNEVMRDFEVNARALFSLVKGNRDGLISRDEMAAAIENFTGDFKQAATLAVLYWKYDEIKGASDGNKTNAGISFKDIAAVSKSFESYALEYNSPLGRISEKSLLGQECFQLAIQTIRSARNFSDSLYISRGNGIRSAINENAICQGNVGNCYFHAPLSSLARYRPEEIKDMITENADSSYTVTFPAGGLEERPVALRVERPNMIESMLFAQGAVYGTWPSVMEKAFGQYLERGGGKGKLHAVLRSDGGGDPQIAIDLLGGKGGDTLHLSGDLTSFRSTIETLSSQDAMVCLWNGTDNALGNGLVNRHAYAVLNYDAKTQTLTLRNPWGRSNRAESSNGVFKMSLAEAHKTFDWMARENR